MFIFVRLFIFYCFFFPLLHPIGCFIAPFSRVSKSKAAIGFDYDEGVGVSSSFVGGGHDEEVDEDDNSDDEYSQ